MASGCVNDSLPWAPPRPVFTSLCDYGLTSHLVKPLLGHGIWWIPSPSSSSQGICDTLCIYQAPGPGKGTLPDTSPIPKHTSGSTQVWGCHITTRNKQIVIEYPDSKQLFFSEALPGDPNISRSVTKRALKKMHRTTS